MSTPPTLSAPADSGDRRAQPWNRAVASQPREVAHAHSADDVIAAVSRAREQQLRVAVRRTGHGALPIGDHVLLVHTAGLDECVVHAEERWARVGAGVLWREVINASAPHGLAPVAGAAPHIGVVGFLTGGGIGPLARSFGVGSDHVRALEVVTGDGRLLRATPEQHEDLFWGLRGGKATLGIVTAVEIDLVPLADFYGGCLWFDRSDTGAVLGRWQDLCEQLPEFGTTSAAIMQLPPLPDLPPPIAGRQTLAVRFGWVGDPRDGARQLDALRAVATPVLNDLRLRAATEIGQVHNDPVEPMPVTEYSALLDGLTEETIASLLAAVQGQPNPQTLIELRLLGGAIARAPRYPSAVSHRDAAFLLFISGVPVPDRAANDQHAERVLAALSDWTAHGLWPNFRASADPDVIARCYDRDTLQRLTGLGDRYDPEHVLHVGQVARC